MIKVHSLSKSYGSRQAISDVSFEINKGEVVGFLGPNGAGKTTTMKILTGYMVPHKGSVQLDGIDILKEPLLAKKKLGYLPEFPPIYTDMYVENYLQYVAKLKLCPKKEIPKRVDLTLEKVGLKEVRKRLIKNLSKGFKQRVGLAQALVSQPEILILDEPTVGLDPKQVKDIRNTLIQLKGQHTIILSTHILSEVQISCDRVIVINKGKIVMQDSLTGLSQKMRAKRQIVLTVRKVSDDLLLKLKKVQGVISVTQEDRSFVLDVEKENSINEDLARFVVNNSYGLIELKEKSFNLEDVFIRLTEQSKK
ncbi:MAG: ABC transporter ATP-binding protein [Bdellovibrionales bacterium]|nr:ABC transporter ATP-binding protein [Bdellovibrionales bacterium]